MPEAWVLLVVTVAVSAVAGLYLLTRSPRPITYANPQEERLTRKVAQAVGCSLEHALPAVRREVEMAPNQSDETLLKRAVYHYRQDLPETVCRVYRDPQPG
jgi:hypothetical protein